MKRLILTLAMLAIAGLTCPVLTAQPITSFETDDYTSAVSPSVVQAERVREHATDGEWALKLMFKGSETDTWPGFGIHPNTDSTQFQTVTFDAYNPGDGPVGLGCRIDFKDGTNQFTGGVAIPSRTPYTAEIWLSAMPEIERIYPYIRMPRHDYTLFIDNVRWATVDARFTPLHFVDDSPPVEPTDEDAARGFVLFQRAFTDVVFANSIPRPEERTGAVRLFATPGEFEPATFSIHALQDLSGVRVSFEGLPVTGEVLPVRCLDKRVTYSSKEYVVAMPVLCERREAVDVAAATSKRFVLDLKIEADAAAKVYEGSVHIDAAGRDRVTVPLVLRVLPFMLSEPTDMFWGEYYQGPKLAKTDEEKHAILRLGLADMRAHGMTSVGLCFGPGESFSWNEDGTLNLDPTGSLYETFMDSYVELGFPAPVIQLSDSGQTAAGMTQAGFSTDEWANAYKTFWIAMQKLHADRGWPEVIVQPVDEPGWQSREEKDRNIRCLKLLKEIPGMRTEQDGPGDAYFREEAGPYSDVWNYNGGIDKPEDIAKYQADGRIILLYNCDVESYRPETDRYVAGWFQVASSASGSFNWSYMSWNGNPYDDNDHKTGTWMHVYPPMGDEPGGPSTGWIGSREGIDDYRYVHTLRELIKRAIAGDSDAAKKSAQAAQEELDAIVASINYSPSVRSQARWTQRGATPDGGKSIGGTLKLPNGWQHGEYEKARWRVARAIIDLMGAMGELDSEIKGDQTSSDAPALLSGVTWAEETPEQLPRGGSQNSRMVTLPVWQQSPALDGSLDEAVWQTAAQLEPFAISSGVGRPQMATDVLAASDGKDLWLGITCHEDKMDYITAGVTEDGGPVWQDDCVEVFVDHNLDQATFRQVLVNSLGAQGWNDTADSNWTAASRAAVKTHDDRWVVELAIPMSDLGITGGEFGFNVCRERRPMEILELSCWSPTGGAFGAPGEFGLAGLGQTWIGGLDVPAATVGLNSFDVTVRNETEETVVFTHRMVLKWAAREQGVNCEPNYSLAPGADRKFTYHYYLADEEAPAITFLILAAHQPNRIIAQRTFSPAVQPPLAMALRPRTYYLSETTGAAELEINVSAEMRDKSRVVFAIYQDATGEIVRQHIVSPIGGNRLGALVNLAGLSEGTYTLWALLDGPEGERLASSSARVVRLRGPFD